MSTIAQLKSGNDTAIRNKVAPDSISQADVSNRLDAVADEFLVRGIKVVNDTASLSTILGTDSQTVYVKGVGLFTYNAGGTADGVNSFAANTTGVFEISLNVFSSTDVKKVAKSEKLVYSMPKFNVFQNFDQLTKSGAAVGGNFSSDGGHDFIEVIGGDATSYFHFPFIVTLNRCCYRMRFHINELFVNPILGFTNVWPGGTYSNFNNPQYMAYFNLSTGAVTASGTGEVTNASFNGFLGSLADGDIIELELRHEYMRKRVVSMKKINGNTGEISVITQTKNPGSDGSWASITHPGVIIADAAVKLLSYEIFSLDEEPYILIDGDSMGQSVRVAYSATTDSVLNANARLVTACIAAGTKKTKGHLATLWQVQKLQPQYLVLYNYLDALYPNQADPANGGHAAWAADFERYVNTVKGLGIKIIFVYPETWTFLANATQCGYYETYLNTTFPADLKLKIPNAQIAYDGTGFHYAGSTNTYIAKQLIQLIKNDGGL